MRGRRGVVVVVSDIIEGEGVQCVIAKAGVGDSKTCRHYHCKLHLWRWELEGHLHNCLTLQLM